MNGTVRPATIATDSRGCLTAAGAAALAAADQGAVPPELAAHLASCARCQDRMLAREALPRDAEAGRSRRTWMWWAIGLLAAALVLALVALVLAARLPVQRVE